jgi:imidazolonepropionase-like amidohydrolase
MLDIVLKAYKSGVTVVPGTDAMAGFALHRELENYVAAGIPAPEVLKMATITSAIVSGVSNELGSISEGKLADMILVNGSPDENISDIRKVVLTVKDGDLYYPEKLYQAIGVSWKE